MTSPQRESLFFERPTGLPGVPVQARSRARLVTGGPLPRRVRNWQQIPVRGSNVATDPLLSERHWQPIWQIYLMISGRPTLGEGGATGQSGVGQARTTSTRTLPERLRSGKQIVQGRARPSRRAGCRLRTARCPPLRPRRPSSASPPNHAVDRVDGLLAPAVPGQVTALPPVPLPSRAPCPYQHAGPRGLHLGWRDTAAPGRLAGL